MVAYHLDSKLLRVFVFLACEWNKGMVMHMYLML
jgi:hypothetical protein